MQSIRRKAYVIALFVAVVGLLAASMLHEPKLVQTQVEQVLDAGNFKQ